MMHVMEEFGPGHDAMARLIKDRLAAMARKRREMAAAHRPATVATEAKPTRVVFQTPHGPAYTVEAGGDEMGRCVNHITLPYVSMIDAALKETAG